MNKYREGESVSMELIGTDAEGLIMSEVKVTWYGFGNPDANRLQMDVIEAVNQAAKGWAAEKAGTLDVDIGAENPEPVPTGTRTYHL